MGAGSDIQGTLSYSIRPHDNNVQAEQSEKQHIEEVISEIEDKLEDSNLKLEWVQLLDYKGEHVNPHHIYDFTSEYRDIDEDYMVVPTQETTTHHTYQVCHGNEKVYQQWAEFCDTHENTHVQLVFHGTTPDAIDSICKCGFDEKKRGTCVGNVRGAGEYTSIHAGTCARYSRHGQQILVCRLALGEKGKDYERPYDGYLYVSRDTRQLLPIAVVKFRCACQ